MPQLFFVSSIWHTWAYRNCEMFDFFLIWLILKKYKFLLASFPLLLRFFVFQTKFSPLSLKIDDDRDQLGIVRLFIYKS